MKYVIIPVSFLLGFSGMWMDAALFKGDVHIFGSILFLVPSIFCIGKIYDEFFNKD